MEHERRGLLPALDLPCHVAEKIGPQRWTVGEALHRSVGVARVAQVGQPARASGVSGGGKRSGGSRRGHRGGDGDGERFPQLLDKRRVVFAIVGI